jgi:hypothetical protein
LNGHRQGWYKLRHLNHIFQVFKFKLSIHQQIRAFAVKSRSAKRTTDIRHLNFAYLVVVEFVPAAVGKALDVCEVVAVIRIANVD